MEAHSRQGGVPMIVTQAQPFNRRTFLSSGFGFLLLGLSDAVHGAELTRSKLDLLIQRALNEPDTTPLSRPSVLGLGAQPLTTKSIEQGDKVDKFGFMVIVPRRADGLLFFEGKEEKPVFFAIHRTGDHLNRVSSAINKGGTLSPWSGSEAEQNFAKQKAFWADLRR
jgi:hypothetical protein